MHCANLCPQNGDRIVTVDSVTSLHSTYKRTHNGQKKPNLRRMKKSGGNVISDLCKISTELHRVTSTCYSACEKANSEETVPSAYRQVVKLLHRSVY